MYERVKALRENEEKTQQEVANHLRMSRTGYSKYEMGENDIPTSVLIKLAQYYNTSTDYILGLTNETKPYKRK
jgi:transcriptional regulator with XRE-family HTH domain